VDFHSVTPALLRLQRPVSSVMLWSPSGFPFGVRRGMIGCGTMPLDTFTYYLLKVGFIPPLRAHWALQKTSSCRCRSRRLQVRFCFVHISGASGDYSSSAFRSASAARYFQTWGRYMALYPRHCPMKRFVKCFFELLTQIIVKVRKCKVQRVCVLHFQLAGSGGCFFLMKLYH